MRDRKMQHPFTALTKASICPVNIGTNRGLSHCLAKRVVFGSPQGVGQGSLSIVAKTKMFPMFASWASDSVWISICIIHSTILKYIDAGVMMLA